MPKLVSAAAACGVFACLSIVAVSRSMATDVESACTIASQHNSQPESTLSTPGQLDSSLCQALSIVQPASSRQFLSPVVTGQASDTISASSSFSATVEADSITLGGTYAVRVILPADSPAPSISFGDRQYPAFPATSASDSGTVTYRALVPTSPLNAPGNHNITVVAGEQQQLLPVRLGARTFPVQSLTVGSGGWVATQEELDAVSNFKSLSSPTRYWDGPFLRPSGGSVSSIYGVRRYYNGVFANDYYHRGVDYAAHMGSPIVAPAGGTIALIGYENQGFAVHGNTVGIDHGQGVVSIFLHLNQIDVEEGQQVSAGQQIGTIGTTGASTGPHLHWGLFVHEVAVDPVPWRYEGF